MFTLFAFATNNVTDDLWFVILSYYSYTSNKVFVSLKNGDVAIFKRVFCKQHRTLDFNTKTTYNKLHVFIVVVVVVFDSHMELRQLHNQEHKQQQEPTPRIAHILLQLHAASGGQTVVLQLAQHHRLTRSEHAQLRGFI